MQKDQRACINGTMTFNDACSYCPGIFDRFGTFFQGVLLFQSRHKEIFIDCLFRWYSRLPSLATRFVQLWLFVALKRDHLF